MPPEPAPAEEPQVLEAPIFNLADIDFDRWESGVTFGLLRRGERRLERRTYRELRRELEGDRHLRRAATGEAITRFVKQGGDPGDFQSFMEWLLEHADEIIAFVQKLIALFTQ